MSRARIRAEVRLLPADRGGRKAPISTGYRSLVRFDQYPVDFGFELELAGGMVFPGATAVGILSVWASDALPLLGIGATFEMREGERVIGHGTIQEIGERPLPP